MPIFSDRLAELRKKRKLTQQQVADEIGINRVTYTNWEKGNREPNFENLIKLASVLGTTTSYLLGETDRDLSDMEKLDLEEKRILLAQNLLDTGVALAIAAKENNTTVEKIISEITQDKEEQKLLQQIFSATLKKANLGNNSETTNTK